MQVLANTGKAASATLTQKKVGRLPQHVFLVFLFMVSFLVYERNNNDEEGRKRSAFYAPFSRCHFRHRKPSAILVRGKHDMDYITPHLFGSICKFNTICKLLGGVVVKCDDLLLKPVFDGVVAGRLRSDEEMPVNPADRLHLD